MTYDIDVDHLYDYDQSSNKKDVDFKWKKNGIYIL
jgi:hypothetical protein